MQWLHECSLLLSKWIQKSSIKSGDPYGIHDGIRKAVTVMQEFSKNKYFIRNMRGLPFIMNEHHDVKNVEWYPRQNENKS